LARNH
jgi:alpha-glucosidase (family GH31 glycosyl hydrolase)